MRLAILKSLFRCSLLLVAALFTGCADNAEDKDFFYHGWSRPKMTPDDSAYFYGGKNHGIPAPEDPRLPSGDLQ